MINYLIRNKLNDKVYIGQTKKSLDRRWSGHIATANSVCPKNYIQNAILKYGAENFEISTIAEAADKDALDNLEKVFIILFQSRHKSYGYNLTAGGEGTVGMRPSEETRQKMRQARLSYRQSPETIAKAAASRRGKKRSPEFSIKLSLAQQNRAPISEATREKQRMAKLGKKRPPRSPEHCRNISKSKMNHSVSEAARLKISESLKKRNMEKKNG